MSFDELGIDENILRGVYAHGFEKPSQIQTLAIPKILEKKDLIAQAQSGTGKTGAFAIGSLCRIDAKKSETQIVKLYNSKKNIFYAYDVNQ